MFHRSCCVVPNHSSGKVLYFKSLCATLAQQHIPSFLTCFCPYFCGNLCALLVVNITFLKKTIIPVLVSVFFFFRRCDFWERFGKARKNTFSTKITVYGHQNSNVFRVLIHFTALLFILSQVIVKSVCKR
jgi:hypothetical protein